MRNKLRRIIINNTIYYYRFTYKYQREIENDYSYISSFKAYIENNKGTPLIIVIRTIGDYFVENTLNVAKNFWSSLKTYKLYTL